jgi:hypothetical protein
MWGGDEDVGVDAGAGGTTVSTWMGSGWKQEQ